jgi:hypothetical protein
MEELSAVVSARAQPNKNQNRYTKKQEQRRNIDEALRKGILKRRCPTSSEVSLLLESIRKNRVTEFALKKLCKFNINGTHDTGTSECSLLSYAVKCNRDKIAIALLRAGASPRISQKHQLDHPTEHFTSGVYVDDLPHPYVVWLKRFTQTWQVADTCMCSVCGTESGNAVRFAACGHTVCDDCFWDGICSTDPVIHEYQACDVEVGCEQVEACQKESAYANLLDNSIGCIYCGAVCCDEHNSTSPHVQRLLLPPEECCASSMAAWQSLPVHYADTGTPMPRGQKPPRVDDFSSAMHLSDIARANPGRTQAQRMEALHKACSRGDVRRVAALIEAGVDVDQRDEYGMTALLLSAWLGRSPVVRLLLRAGADRDAADPLGNTLLSLTALRVPSINSGTAESTWHPFIKCSTMSETEISPPGLATLYRRGYVLEYPTPATQHLSAPVLSVLIPPRVSRIPDAAAFWSQHAVKGAEPGAYCFDHCFAEEFLDRLLSIFRKLPVAPSEKAHCASRSYFCDVAGDIARAIEKVVRLLGSCPGGAAVSGEDAELPLRVKVFQQLRFMHYEHDGSALAPHVDLARTDVHSATSFEVSAASRPVTSTHTLILYLTDCDVGGETILLDSLPRCGTTSTEGFSAEHPASVAPRRGRLLLFPHNCPHEGSAVFATHPKILLRGEVYLEA